MLRTLIRFKFSTIAKKVIVPYDKLEFSYSRSSGPGGQNVNKLNTKCELRVHIDSAYWIPENAKEEIKEFYGNKINNEGYLVITSQEHRTQDMNKKEAINKLQNMIDIAMIPRKERIKEKKPETEWQEERRIREKKSRKESNKKEFRREEKEFRF